MGFRSQLLIGAKPVYFRKALKAPAWETPAVLAKDGFQFVEIWLRENASSDTSAFWSQAGNFYKASQALDVKSSPLASYYCMLNAVKTLLIVKAFPFADHHGIHGVTENQDCGLDGELTTIKNGGVVGALSKYLQEYQTSKRLSIKAILSNLSFVHRSYCLTYSVDQELFLSISNPTYVTSSSGREVWWQAEVSNIDAANFVLSLPGAFELRSNDEWTVVRKRQRVRWLSSSPEELKASIDKLNHYHKAMRLLSCPISARTDAWYLKGVCNDVEILSRYEVTLIIAAMHRLSELVRYDPLRLELLLAGREAWLLTEFIELALDQFIAIIVCEITNMEFRRPGVRR